MNNEFITLVGGTALLIYAIEALSKTIQYLAGSKFRTWINIFASNRLAAAGMGGLLACVMGSSSAVTVMLVGLANARMLSLERVLSVTLGAVVGTTLIVQVMAFRVSEYALVMIAIGVGLTYLSKEDNTKYMARGLIYLGLMFMSMTLIKEAGVQLEGNEFFQYAVSYFRENPIASFLLATALTAFIQSSAATIAFMMSIVVAQNGTVSEAIPWVLGANLGTTSTAFLAGAVGGLPGKQAALGHLLMKFVGILLCYPFMKYLGEAAVVLGNDVGRQIAHTHTLFNLFVAVLFLPIISLCAKAVRYFLPEKEEDGPFVFHYLDPNALSAPELALAQAHREVLRLSDLVEQMLEKSLEPFRSGSLQEIDSLREKDRIIDFLNKGIKIQLTRLSRKEMTQEQVDREFQLLFRTNDLESIGDIVDKNILGLARKNIKKGYVFSEEGWEEIVLFHAKVLECLKLSTAHFASRDKSLAVKVTLLSEEIEELMVELSEKHVQRLHEGVKESIATTSVHLDLLGHLQRISSLSVNFLLLPDLRGD